MATNVDAPTGFSFGSFSSDIVVIDEEDREAAEAAAAAFSLFSDSSSPRQKSPSQSSTGCRPFVDARPSSNASPAISSHRALLLAYTDLKRRFCALQGENEALKLKMTKRRDPPSSCVKCVGGPRGEDHDADALMVWEDKTDLKGSRRDLFTPPTRTLSSPSLSSLASSNGSSSGASSASSEAVYCPMSELVGAFEMALKHNDELAEMVQKQKNIILALLSELERSKARGSDRQKRNHQCLSQSSPISAQIKPSSTSPVPSATLNVRDSPTRDDPHKPSIDGAFLTHFSQNASIANSCGMNSNPNQPLSHSKVKLVARGMTKTQDTPRSNLRPGLFCQTSRPVSTSEPRMDESILSTRPCPTALIKSPKYRMPTEDIDVSSSLTGRSLSPNSSPRNVEMLSPPPTPEFEGLEAPAFGQLRTDSCYQDCRPSQECPTIMSASLVSNDCTSMGLQTITNVPCPTRGNDKECPMCGAVFPEGSISQNEFETHVQSHFEEAAIFQNFEFVG